jgi:hypothetical protein
MSVSVLVVRRVPGMPGAHRLRDGVRAAGAGGRRAGQQARQSGAVGERQERGKPGVR